MDLPDLAGKHFTFIRHDTHSAWPDNTVVIPKDWCNIDWELSTGEIIDICNKIMTWYGISSVNLVANRTRMSREGGEYWRNNRIFLKRQLTGWCDMYTVERKR